ncbi:zinc finger, CCHC-type containing LTR copia-type gag-polypeptide [Tanacetum coccineum]
MAVGNESTDSLLPLSTVLHMITIKLISSSYLLWKNQMLPLLANQKLTVYIDGSLLSPSPTIVTNDVIASNPAYISWISAEQRALILIQSWLTEEAMADPGHKTARALWCTIEAAYSHDSAELMHTLGDSLRHLWKGSSTVGELGRKFKHICDQLTAIGHRI